MIDYIVKELSVKTETKIVMLIMDGLGGCELEQGKPTELEAALTPNMDELVRGGICGLTDPVAPGIMPGSGPSHLALFGYNPVKHIIGRGVLAAAGVAFEMQPSDVAARGNFSTMDENGLITDRRAGRISTEKNAELCALLQDIEIDGVKIYIKPVKEHRSVVVFRGEGLHGKVTDSDPQQTGLAPLTMRAHDTGSETNSQKTAAIANKLSAEIRNRLKGLAPANFMLLRGFDAYPHLPSMHEIYKLDPAAIAVYPDYKGIARIVGMDIIETGDDIQSEFTTLERNWANHDFFYIHIKKTDSYGEDGNFDAKVRIIEEVDNQIPRLMNLNPDVVIITGDHSTPSLLKNHSWHPVPALLHSARCRRDAATQFNETACLTGGIGRIQAVSLMPLAMANALKLVKFGA